MNRAPFGMMMLAGTLLAALPASVEAQTGVQVGLYFEFGDDGWRAYRPVYDSAPRDRYRGPQHIVYHAQGRAVRVPRGHLPPPGLCRLWYPGRPPGHQPRPRPCEHLLRTHRHSGAVILGMPAFLDAVYAVDGRFRYDDDRRFREVEDERRFRFDDDDRDFRFDDDDRGFRVVDDGRGFRVVSADDGFRDDRGRGRGRGRR